MKHFFGVLFVLAGLGGRASAQLGEFEARRSSAYAGLKQGLEDHAAWCTGKRLFEERSHVYELLLELDPGHPVALRTLGYVKGKGGVWGPPKTPKVFNDYDGVALRAAPERLATIRASFVTSLCALLEAPELSCEQRGLVTADILRYDPDNELVHRQLGEVQHEGRWVIAETVRSDARRAELREIVRDGLERAPPAEPTVMLERERMLELPLRVVATSKVRVLGTGSDEELFLMAQALHAVEHVLRSVFQVEVELPRDCTIFLFVNPGDRYQFLQRHPDVQPEQRAFLESLAGSGIPGTADFAFWEGDVQRRIDGIVRMVMGYMLSGAFGITVDHGWAYEGIGLYLTRAIVRTRLNWFAQPSRDLAHEKDFALRKRLLEPETNWVDEAHRMLQDGKAPALAPLLGKGVNDLTTEDLLFSYLLATYVLEAEAERAAQILDRTGEDEAPVAAFESGVGRSLADFEPHMTRWLAERR